MKLLLLALALASSSAFSVTKTTTRHAKTTTTTTKTALSALLNNNDNSSDRRGFLLSTLTAAAAALAYHPQPALAAAVDYKAVSNDIAALIKANPDWGPTLVRVAWHSSGTYDKVSKTGGSEGGTMHYKSESDHGGNAGLEITAVKWLEPIHSKYEGLSYGDLYTLAGGRLGERSRGI